MRYAILILMLAGCASPYVHWNDQLERSNDSLRIEILEAMGGQRA